ncbi:cilia- and flagella-associated protein 410-like [Drosophila elegans]|uniref:cilia- and flagella-associated protein 410-like n=1 Tax=Drosophila elegans TaxID=30023 RepID=UPI001BC8601C|nr:cilia- and flagella-associated protein 410-like [Drosophila elegans]
MNRLTEWLVEANSKCSDYRNMVKLNAWDSHLEDIKICLEMLHLEVLSLSVNKINMLSSLQNCHRLKELYIRKNKIASFEELNYLTNAPQCHFISRGRVETEGKKYLEQKEKLEKEAVEAEAAIDGAKKRSEIKRQINEITREICKRNIKRIDMDAELRAAEKKLNKVPAEKRKSKCSDYRNIVKLNAWDSDLEDIKICLEMLHLEVLSLSVNKINMLSSLQNCHRLKELYIRKNKIASFEELNYLTNAPQCHFISRGRC